MPDGTITNLRPNRDDGYGFGTITPDGGDPGLVFYSRDAEGAGQSLARLLHNLRHAGTKRAKPFDLLTVGQRVTFVTSTDSSQAGRASAEQVRPRAN